MKRLLMSISLVALTAYSWGQKNEKTVSAKIEEVVVFTAGAQITHIGQVSLKAGENIIRIKGLPASLDPQSIQVKGNNAYTIMSTKHQIVYGDELMSPKVKELRDSLEEMQFKLAEIQMQRDNLHQERALLTNNYSIKGANSVITAEDIVEVADMLKERLKVIGYKGIELNGKESKVQETIAAIQNRLAVLQSNSSNNPSVIDLVLIAKNEARSEVKFQYFVANAGWVPSYDLRADDVSSPIDFSYKARVYQSTGLDWEDVKLTISTGNPSVSGQLPVLNPWWLNMYDPAAMAYRTGRKMKADAYAPSAAPAMQREMSLEDSKGASYNEYKTSASYTQVNNNAVNTEFSISIPYDIPSDNDGVEVVMQHDAVKADYRYVAVPKQDPSAYLMAFMTNWAQYGLLPGESNIYFRGTFVGQGYIDPAMANDTLMLNMGRDMSVVVKRDMVKDFCKTGTWAGKKWVTKAYEITVKNQKTVPIKIEIVDQLPKSNNSELEIVTEETSGAKLNEETGELRWLMELTPNQIEKKTIRFTVKYPRKMMVNL